MLQEEEVGGDEWRSVDRVTSPSLREKLLHLRDYFPGLVREPGMWSLLGGPGLQMLV